jgi:hypothetical protein
MNLRYLDLTRNSTSVILENDYKTKGDVMNTEKLEIEYHVLKDSVAKQQNWPYSPLQTELIDEGVVYVDKKAQQDIVTITEWVNNETRIYNKKNTDKSITFRVRLGSYFDGEEE